MFEKTTTPIYPKGTLEYHKKIKKYIVDIMEQYWYMKTDSAVCSEKWTDAKMPLWRLRIP